MSGMLVLTAVLLVGAVTGQNLFGDKFNPSKFDSCFRRPVDGNPCVYNEYHQNGQFLAMRQCAAGTAFSSTLCLCGIRNDDCKPKVLNTNLDPVVPKEYNCYRRPVNGNPCVYDEYRENGELIKRRSCAAGTAFNATICLCGILNDECKPNVYVLNQEPDAQCSATIVMEFPQNEIAPVSYTEKTNPRQLNPYAFQIVGYEGNGYEGIFSNDPNNGSPGLQIPFFSNNMIKGPFIIKTTFRADNRQENPFIKLVSNEGGNDCPGSLDITAQFTGDNCQISAKAVGEQNAQISGEMFVPNGGDITVVFIYDGTNIRGYAMSSATGQITLTGSGVVGGKINSGRCNLQVAGGLIGVLKEFKVYEACGNTNRQI